MPAKFINVNNSGRAKFTNVNNSGRAVFGESGSGTTTTTTTAPACYCYRVLINGTLDLQYTACVSGTPTTITGVSGDQVYCSRTVPTKVGGTGTFDSVTACEVSPGVPLTCTSNTIPCQGCSGSPA